MLSEKDNDQESGSGWDTHSQTVGKQIEHEEDKTER